MSAPAWRRAYRASQAACRRGQSGDTLHLGHDRMQRTVDVLRRTEHAQARVRLVNEVLLKRGDEARLADPGLTGKQHHLALPRLRAQPAPLQQGGFLIAPDQRGELGRVQRLEAAGDGADSLHRPGIFDYALEIPAAEILQVEQPAEKLARGVTDDDRVGLRDPLQVRRQIRRLANDLALVRVLRSDQFADHHHAGCDADADLQRPARLQRADRGGQFEAARTARSALSS